MGRPKRPRVAANEQELSRLRDNRQEHGSIPCHDCVDEKLSGNSTVSRLEIRSSWLDDVQWIEHSSSMEMDVEENTREVSMEEEIKALILQLSQVKRRLGPAADRCAEVLNAVSEAGTFVEGMHDKTSARQEFEEARRSCNPYEVLGERQRGGMNRMFVNRSAIKLANIDALLGFSLTQHDGTGPFVFADLCGAPGGFSEYLMYRCHENGVSSCRGYGMSLLGTNEHGVGTAWKLQHMSKFIGRTHTQYNVCKGEDGTGDVYRWENVEALRQCIQADMIQQNCSNESICDHGREDGVVHLVVADGGFDAQRDSECQEGLAQKIVVCQAAAAVALLKRGGTLVLKMFGFRTSTIRTVMHSLFYAFERITIIKPVSSRPASAERYAVFMGYNGTLHGWDGLTWRNNMFVGKVGFDENVSNLNEYLDKVDRDMLTLNLKACFDILSCLERKCQGINSYQSQVYCNSSKSQTVDVRKYRRAWRLR